MTRSNYRRRAFALALIFFLPAAIAAAPEADKGDVDAAALYNQGAAVIQNTRTVELASGKQHIGWPVTGRLRADTVWLEGDGVRLIGLTARASDDDGRGLLARRVGQPVTLVRNGPDGGEIRRRATLVGIHGESLLVRVDDRIERITADAPWWVSWRAGETAPRGLQLVIESENAGTQPLTATYQIDGPSWQASYTGRFDAEAGRLSLQSMAVVDNSGGARLAADTAWLVAGDVARANGRPQPMAMARGDAAFSEAGPAQAAGDLYRYALDDGLEVAAGAVRAVSLMPALSFEAERSYRFENNWYTNSREGRSHAEVRLTFDNTADKPLPAGVVRVYDAQRVAGLMGEDRIGDTPEDAPVTLVLGRAFDVTGERRIVDDERIGEDRRRRTVEITLHNASDDPASVDVVERLPDTAKIVSASVEPQPQAEANTATWRVDVPAGGKTSLRYSAQWPGR